MDTVLQAGDILLGKYRVERVLGQGGMGIVVAARHMDLGQLFAIKCMLPTALAHEDAVERFLREARAAAALRSEHVVKVVDVGRLDTGAPYMVMEHLAGTDLGAMLEARGALPVGEAVSYVLEACEALAEAHAMGIVHRDLKPPNLFIAKRPNGTTCVKVLDFGISKQMRPDEVALTKTGAIMGSPLYMSPEQMVSAKAADARSDVWALGVVLYELCTGRAPFQGEYVTEVVARVVQEDPAPPSSVRSNIPAGLDAVIVRCLQKQPERRYASIEELARALRPFAGAPAPTRASPYDIADDETVPASTADEPAFPVVGARAAITDGKAAGRRRVLIASGAGLAIVALAAVVGGSLLWGPTSATSTPVAASATAGSDPPRAPALAPSTAAPPTIEPAASASIAPAVTAPPTVSAAPAEAPRPAKTAPVVKAPSSKPPPAAPATTVTATPAPAPKGRETLF